MGESSHLVEFPSVLLPQGCKPGSIVTIACQRNQTAEQEVARAFWDLQDRILDTFGKATPEPPVLKVRNVTQTSVALEWEPLKLASSKLVSLSIWRNNQRVALIPNPTTNLSTKMSGLGLDMDYTFHLVLQTTAGCYASNVIKIRTHTLDNTTGVKVCFGSVQPEELLEASHEWIQQMGASTSDNLQIDTTHFVCTGPGSSPSSPSGSQLYQRAVQMSIPTVTPAWLEACVTEKRLAAVKNYALGKSAPATTSSYRRSHSATASKASLGSARQAPQQQPSSSQTQLAAAAAASTSSTTPPVTSEPSAEVAQEATPSSEATELPQTAHTDDTEATVTGLDDNDKAPTSQQEPAQQKPPQEATDGVELQTPVDTPADDDARPTLQGGGDQLEDSGEDRPKADDEDGDSKHDDAESTGDMEDVKL